MNSKQFCGKLLLDDLKELHKITLKHVLKRFSDFGKEVETASFRYDKSDGGRNSEVTGGQQTPPLELGHQVHTKGDSHISGEMSDGIAGGAGKISSPHGAKSLNYHSTPHIMAQFRWIKGPTHMK